MALLAAALVVLFAAPVLAEEGMVGSVWVNDAPLHGEGSRRLTGCSMNVEVRDLPEGTHDVSIVIRAMEQSGNAVLLDAHEPAAVGSYSAGGDLTQAIADAGLVPKANGHHLRVVVIVDGGTARQAAFWLACGAQQHSGHSWRVQFHDEWRAPDGAPVAVPGALGGFTISASSKFGTATCTHTVAGGPLVCTYVATSGHGGEGEDGGEGDECGDGCGGEEPKLPGLKVSGRGTYTVTASAVPDGWAVDASTLGEFSPQARCGAGEDPNEPIGERVCPHTVTLTAAAVAPPEPPPPGPPIVSPVTTPVAPGVAGAATGEGPLRTLPATGRADGRLAALGGALTLLGLVLAAGARRRVPGSVMAGGTRCEHSVTTGRRRTR